MKPGLLITSAIIGVALVAPVAAHHNSPSGTDLEIGDMMGYHDAAIAELDATGSMAMDPSNAAPTDSSAGSMPEDLDPQPNGTNIPDALPDTASGSGGTSAEEGRVNGATRAGTYWP